MTRLSKIISAANWRYAVGEVILIVIGVTIALAASSWYEGRQERREGMAILQQLHQTLSEDLQDIRATREMTRQREQYLTELLDHLESDEPYSAELGTRFQALIGWRIVRIKTAPFETLKEQGYKLISNSVLREKLISFYEDHYATLEYNLNLDRDFAIEKVQPYFFDNFVLGVSAAQDVDGGTQAWVPKDYNKIRDDSYIANLCRFRADLLRRFALRQYGDTVAAIEEILELIQIETAAMNQEKT